MIYDQEDMPFSNNGITPDINEKKTQEQIKKIYNAIN